MSKKSILITFITVAIIGLCGYTYLGGFHEVKISKVAIGSYKIAGKHFEGKVQSKVLEHIFFEAKEYVHNHNGANSIAIIYYKSTDNSIGKIDCFAGALLEPNAENLPKDFEIREIMVKEVLRARFEGHRLVTPEPNTMYQKIKKYADKNNIRLQKIYIEKYFSDDAIEVDYLIID